MSKLFVYGTLKRGYRAHDMLEHFNARFLREAVTTPDYQLYRVNWFPGMVVEDGECGVKGELYEVSEEVFTSLDRYEGAPRLFNRETITLDDGEEAISYIFKEDTSDLERVENGVWEDGKNG